MLCDFNLGVVFGFLLGWYLYSGWSFLCCSLSRFASATYGSFSSGERAFHSSPRRLLISEFNIRGHSSAIRLRSFRDQTMYAFIGRFMCSLGLVILLIFSIGTVSKTVVDATSPCGVDSGVWEWSPCASRFYRWFKPLVCGWACLEVKETTLWTMERLNRIPQKWFIIRRLTGINYWFPRRMGYPHEFNEQEFERTIETGEHWWIINLARCPIRWVNEKKTGGGNSHGFSEFIAWRIVMDECFLSKLHLFTHNEQNA